MESRYNLTAIQRAEKSLKKGLLYSLVVHVALLIFYFTKTTFFPSEPVPYVPTLRVDIVGLPDQLKKDLDKVKNTKGKKEASKKQKAKEKKKKAAEAKKSKEMALRKKKEAEKKARQDKMSSALKRVEALNKLQDEEDDTLLKGNTISKGSSVSGEARENAETTYLDDLHAKLKNNWALPIWLSRQNLSARVRIKINSFGRVIGIRFEKPSGNPQFDAAIRQCLQQSQPFPEPPAELQKGFLLNGILLGFPL